MSGLTDDSVHAADAASRRRLDPAFKLFGRTIPVASDHEEDKLGGEEGAAAGEITSLQDVVDETSESDDDSSVPDELGSSSGSNDGGDEEKMVEAAADEFPNHGPLPVVDQSSGEPAAAEAPCLKEEDIECPDQATKKPDKPVPCPRCESLDTKFCYFNNYNVNQPRHFCKNCQRYWTAGGTLRNVPIGAGRRKNKHSIITHQNVISEGFVARGDPPEPAQQLLSAPGSGLSRHLKRGVLSSSSHPGHLLPLDVHSLAALDSPSSSAVLSFGQESPLAGVSAGAPARSEVLQGYNPEVSQVQAVFKLNANNGGTLRSPSGSNVPYQKQGTGRNPAESFESPSFNPATWQPSGVEPMPPSTESSQLPVPYPTSDVKPEVGGPNDFSKYVDAAFAWASSTPFPLVGGPWQYAANLGWGNGNPGHSLANSVSGAPCTWTCNPEGGTPAPAPNITALPPWATAMGSWPPSGIPWPLLQNPLWVAAPAWASAWTMPWMAPFTAVAAAAAAAAAVAAAVSTAKPDVGHSILGKHPREQGEADAGQCSSLLIPKTLRINDPGEAARSSIWTALGLELRSDKMASGGIFGNLSAEGGSTDRGDPQAQAHNNNPAALNRSINFQESNSMPVQNTDVYGK